MPDTPHSLDRCFRLVLDEQKTVASVRLEPGYAPAEVTPEAIVAVLDGRGIRRAIIDHAGIERLCAAAAPGPATAVEEIVARSTPPTDGLDAVLTLAPGIRARFDALEERKRRLQERLRGNGDLESAADAPGDATVDFRTQSAFVIVPKGEIIGTVSEPTTGVDGEDVFGKAALARSGRSLKDTLGANLVRRADGTVAAEKPGRLIIEGNAVRVATTLEILGPVDYATGNVDFPGDVSVTKGMRDHFQIRAEGSVILHDLVEASTIDCRGGLTVTAGIVGRGKGKISVGGDVSANYLDNIEGVIEGALRIAREINACRLRVGGSIDSPSAVLIGGETVASQRVELAQVGGEGGVRTELILGALDELEGYLAPVASVTERVTSAAAKAKRELEDLERNITKLTATQAERLTELQFDIANTAAMLGKLDEANAKLLGAVRAHSRAVLAVHRGVFPGAVIWVRGHRIEPGVLLKGPLLLDLDDAGVPSYRPLKGDAPRRPLAGVAKVHPDDRLRPLPAGPAASAPISSAAAA